MGPGYGDYGNGMVMYEAGHEFKKNTDADRNAIRAFLNFLILSGVEKSLDVKATIPSDATAGSTVQASVTVTKGTPPYTYQWQSDCNASFSDPTGSATSITFPDEGPCHVKVTVKDQCGRATFDTRLVDVKTRKGTVSWRKTDTENNPLAGSSWTLTGPDGQSRTITDNGEGDEDRTDGSFRVTGLDMGAYTLTESQAPSGFHKDDSSHPFTLDNTHPDWTFASGFVNSPTPATVTVNGSKTLTGRDSKNGEAFRFTFIPSDQATRQAVRGKTITVSKTRSVGGLRDGVAKDFTLATATVSKAGTYTFDAAVDRTDCPGDLACSKAGYRITITAIGGTASSGGTGRLTVDGSCGPATIRRWQQVMGTSVDGIISGQYRPDGRTWGRPALVDSCVRYGGGGSNLIRAVQRKLSLTADGLLGPATIRALQKHLGVAQDSWFGPGTARALQSRLNTGRF